MYKKLFLFLLLFGFFVLEINYKTGNVKSQENSVVSFSLGMVTALAKDSSLFCDGTFDSRNVDVNVNKINSIIENLLLELERSEFKDKIGEKIKKCNKAKNSIITEWYLTNEDKSVSNLEEELCKKKLGDWFWNQKTCICPSGHKIIRKIKCVPLTESDSSGASVSNSSSGESSSTPPRSKACDSFMLLRDVNNKIADLDEERDRLDNKYTGRGDSLTPDDTKIDRRIVRDKINCRRIKYELEKDEEKETQCKEDRQKIKEAGFGKACAKFSRGMGCESAITACAMCPDPDEEAEFNSYSCVTVHKKAKCPLLAGEELKLAKEKRDNFQEEVKEQEEEASELEKDIADKKNELNKSLAELEENFNEAVAEFERETENAKEDLEAELNENTATIKNEVSKQIAQIQEAVDKSLEIAHSFENAITETNMKHRLKVKKVYAECRVQAQAQLAKYRNKRKRAIVSGTYRVSLSSLTNKNRISFAQRDVLKLKQFYQECLVLRKSDLKDLKLAHQQKMRIIAQKREQYQKKLKSLTQKAVGLNKMAYEQQNQLVQEYAKRMGKIISQYSKQHNLALKNYNKNKQTLLAETSKINVLQKHLMDRRQNLDQKRKELVAEQQLISYLKSKGVSEENDDGNEEFAEAAGALEDYKNAIDIAYDSCKCDDVKVSSRSRKDQEDEDEKVAKWQRTTCSGSSGIKRKKNNLEDGNLEIVIQTLSPGDR